MRASAAGVVVTNSPLSDAAQESAPTATRSLQPSPARKSIVCLQECGNQPLLTSASSSAASSFARQEARTDLDLASQKVHKSSGPLQMPFAPPLVGFGHAPEFPDCGSVADRYKLQTAS